MEFPFNKNTRPNHSRSKMPVPADEETGMAHSTTALNNATTPTHKSAVAHNHHHHHHQHHQHHHNHHIGVGHAQPPPHPPPSTTNAVTSSSSIVPAPGAADMISPSLMARYLHDELKASEVKHCDTCVCASGGGRDLTVLADTAHSYSVGTQTLLHGDAHNALCLRCNSNLNSPSRTNSPYIMKLVKSSDSVISETKSSYSGSLAALDMTGFVGGGGGGGSGGCDPQRYANAAATLAPLAQQQRKDDLTVNPILGHHRLCDRKMTSSAKREREAAAAAAAAASVELQIENELRGLSSKQPMGKAPMAATPKMSTTAATMPTTLYGGDGANPAAGQQQQHQQQPMDTTSGSTNSLWSKSSSSNNPQHTHNGGAAVGNVEGAKMFETFNRNLIKSIKVSWGECEL